MIWMTTVVGKYEYYFTIDKTLVGVFEEREVIFYTISSPPLVTSLATAL